MNDPRDRDGGNGVFFFGGGRDEKTDFVELCQSGH